MATRKQLLLDTADSYTYELTVGGNRIHNIYASPIQTQPKQREESGRKSHPC